MSSRNNKIVPTKSSPLQRLGADHWRNKTESTSYPTNQN